MTFSPPLPGWADRSHIVDVSSRGIASFVAEMIRTEQLAHGALMPQVRVLAEKLRVSPASVSGAWALLKKRGLLVGSGKSGTRVVSPAESVRTLEDFERVPGSNDLRLLYPDPELLPALDQALMGAARQPNLNEYYGSSILPGLLDAVAPLWPMPAESYLVANGGSDALWTLLRSNTVPGDRIVVESPTQPQLITLMLDLGLTLVPVDYGANGLDLDQLEAALSTRPAVVFFQPRAQVPTGQATSAENAAAIAAIIASRTHRPLIVEYDDLAALAQGTYHSVGIHLPENTAVIRSFEKSYGPDLRLAVIGASAATIRNAHAQIRVTRQWTSRVLQSALLWMLEDEETGHAIVAAREIYAERLRTLVALLRENGVDTTSADGFCVWVPVFEVSATVTELAAHGVVVMRGSASYPGAPLPHIRVATSRLDTSEMPRIAGMITVAARRFS